MNCIVPFTKNIQFKTNIAEVTSISLEHDYTINEQELLGNFIISGEYKSHEVSVNKEPFEYTLPFNVSLTENINPETLEFEISDFTYDLIDNDTMKIDIDYLIKADEIERIEEPIELIDELISDEPEEETIIEEKQEDRVEEEIIETPTIEEITTADITAEADNNREDMQMEKAMILNSVSNEEEIFIDYHIHILKETETIESLCSKYETNINLLEKYNDITNLNIGDKIIIPATDE